VAVLVWDGDRVTEVDADPVGVTDVEGVTDRVREMEGDTLAVIDMEGVTDGDGDGSIYNTTNPTDAGVKTLFVLP
jgi:hypothetical protein